MSILGYKELLLLPRKFPGSVKANGQEGNSKQRRRWRQTVMHELIATASHMRLDTARDDVPAIVSSSLNGGTRKASVPPTPAPTNQPTNHYPNIPRAHATTWT